MGLPTLTKSWLFLNNQRISSAVSLNDMMAQVLFNIKNFLVATVGWTVKYTCDGTTGPTSSSDHTDRISSKSNCTTQGAAVTNANSFFVLTDGNAVDLCFSFVGASADICRISYSATGVYTPAGTSNQTPTATDEVLISSATTIINNAATLDRIIHLQASSDKKLFRFWVYRNGTGIRHIKTEQVTSIVSAMAFSPAYMTWQSNLFTVTAGSTGHDAISGIMATDGSNNSASARINGTTTGLGGAAEIFLGSVNPFNTATIPHELQAAWPINPLGISSNTTNRQGKVGNRFDVWFPQVNGIVQGTMFGTMQFVTLGSVMVPWDGVSPTVVLT